MLNQRLFNSMHATAASYYYGGYILLGIKCTLDNTVIVRHVKKSRFCCMFSYIDVCRSLASNLASGFALKAQVTRLHHCLQVTLVMVIFEAS